MRPSVRSDKTLDDGTVILTTPDSINQKGVLR